MASCTGKCLKVYSFKCLNFHFYQSGRNLCIFGLVFMPKFQPHGLYMLAWDNVYLWEVISLTGIFPLSRARVLSAVNRGQQMMITISWLLLKGFNFFPQALQIPLQKPTYNDSRYYTHCEQQLGNFKLISVKLLDDDED